MEDSPRDSPVRRGQYQAGHAAPRSRCPVAFGVVDTTRRAPHNPAGTRIHRMRGSRSGECPERQRGRTVNPLADAFVGSSPTSPTKISKYPRTLRATQILSPSTSTGARGLTTAAKTASAFSDRVRVEKAGTRSNLLVAAPPN